MLFKVTRSSTAENETPVEINTLDELVAFVQKQHDRLVIIKGEGDVLFSDGNVMYHQDWELEIYDTHRE